MIRLPYRLHQRAGGPHGKPQGEKQAEQHQPHVGFLAYVQKIRLHNVHHFTGQEFPQHQQNCRYIQIQQAQERADKNKKREDHKQQVERQRRALHPYFMLKKPPYHQPHAPRRRSQLPSLPSVVSPLRTSPPRPPDSSPPSLPSRSGQWARGTALDAPAGLPPGPGA